MLYQATKRVTQRHASSTEEKGRRGKLGWYFSVRKSASENALSSETRRYWKSLFHCYDVPDLPRTDNDLEHLFGTCRYHERRASGRVRGSAGLVVRGAVRLPAIAAANLLPVLDGTHLAPGDFDDWRQLRAKLEQRRVPRIMGRRFRADPDGYLRGIEEDLRPYLPV